MTRGSPLRSSLGLRVRFASVGMALFLALALAVPPASAAKNASAAGIGGPVRQLFQSWMAKYGHAFRGKAFLRRLRVFSSNLAFIERTNKKNLGFTLAANQFAHLTQKEFRVSFLGVRLKENPSRLAGHAARNSSSSSSGRSLRQQAALPASVDRRQRGVVTPVKDQGQCGDCWAFSVTGAIESASAIRTGQLVALSEQQLADCTTPSDGAWGCNGGGPIWIRRWAGRKGGLNLGASYPYTSGRSGSSGSCRSGLPLYSPICNVVQVSQDERSLQAAVALQPVSVCVDASASFQFYSSGIFTGSCDSSGNINHAILAVGYGTSNGQDYWIVKNSWGSGWGEGGYIRMARNVQAPYGLCNIAVYSSYSYA